jgi:ankyrin repeat protein
MGHLELANVLLDHGASLNSTFSGPTGQGSGLTPLMIACLEANQEMVHLFLKKGAEVNSQTRLNGWTAAMYALCSKKDSQTRIGICTQLLDKGADLQLKSQRGKTVFRIAVEVQNKDVLNWVENFKPAADKRADVTRLNLNAISPTDSSKSALNSPTRVTPKSGNLSSIIHMDSGGVITEDCSTFFFKERKQSDFE